VTQTGFGLSLPDYPWDTLAPYRQTAAAHPGGNGRSHDAEPHTFEPRASEPRAPESTEGERRFEPKPEVRDSAPPVSSEPPHPLAHFEPTPKRPYVVWSSAPSASPPGTGSEREE